MAGELIKSKEEAKRFARVIVSDIVAYNIKKVEDGIKNDNLFDLLTEELKEGETYYNSRVLPDICNQENYFNSAVIDLLIKPRDYVESNIW